MKVLIDTQSAIWFSLNNPQLSKVAREILENTEHECYISIASFWEMSIKINLGKLDMDGFTLVEFMDKMQEHNFLTVPIERLHVIENSQLPFHHRDPFDRIIIAQAIAEQMTIVSNDRAFDDYPVQRLW